MIRRPFRLLASAGACALFIPAAASAADFTITTGQTVIDGQTLDTTGDIGIVELAGTISTPASAAVTATANGVQFSNAGTVSGSSYGFKGLDASIITNSGLLIGSLNGIFASNSNTISNSGLVFGTNGYGINVLANNRITNTGSITAGLLGVWATDGNTILNSGTIAAEVAAFYLGNSNVIDSSGTVTGGEVGIAAKNLNEITNTGVIAGEAYYGIYVSDSNTITNSGSISGNYGGIRVESLNTVINTGSITATSDGIIACDSNVINNAGVIVAGDDGIRGCDGNTIVNSGTIKTDDVGLLVDDDNQVTNTGIIEAGTIGIDVIDDDNQVTNTGIIEAGTIGIDGADDNALDNSGTITGGTSAIRLAAGGTIINSGTLVGATSAVEFTGSGNHLSILLGSIIEGTLAMGTGNSLYIDKGMNTAFTYSGAPSVSTGGSPFADSGSIIAAVDPTGFSAEDEMLVDLTDGVSGIVEARLVPSRGNGPAGLVLRGASAIVPVADPLPAMGPTYWAAGLGSYREQSGTEQDVGFDTQLAGVLLGADVEMRPGLRVGALAGASNASFETRTGSQDIESRTYLAGAYGGLTQGGLDFALSMIAGVSVQSSSRSVLNNMVAGGVETARSDYKGFLFSPSLTVSRDFALQVGRIAPSISLRYAGMYLPAYDEDGSTADLSVVARGVHVGELEAQVSYGVLDVETSGGALDAAIRVGADASIAAGSTVESEIIGQSLDIEATRGKALRGFGAAAVSFSTSQGLRLFLDAKAGYGTDDALTGSASGGFELAL